MVGSGCTANRGLIIGHELPSRTPARFHGLVEGMGIREFESGVVYICIYLYSTIFKIHYFGECQLQPTSRIIALSSLGLFFRSPRAQPTHILLVSP